MLSSKEGCTRCASLLLLLGMLTPAQFQQTSKAGHATHSTIVNCPPCALPPPPGRRPAFCINSVTVLGRQSLAELAAEAAELAAAASAAGAAGPAARSGSPPSAATISKSLLALAVLALGVPIIPQARAQPLVPWE